MKKYRYTIIFILCMMLASVITAYSQTQWDIVNGNLIQFNDNGGWCWYQDERAVIDFKDNKLIAGSVASGRGIGGPARYSNIDAVVYDLQTGLMRRYLLEQGGGQLWCDDHNTPAFLMCPGSKCLAMFTGHNSENYTYYRMYEHDYASDSGTWSPTQIFDWNANIPGGTNWHVTYSNTFYLSSGWLTVNIARGHNKNPNIMLSTDGGRSWSYGGQLVTGSSAYYNNGYFKYWSDGVDRIDFIFTEAHPRDTATSIYHGYIKNGQTFRSDGTLVDADTYDTLFVPTFHDFTKIFAEGTIIGNDTMRRCWTADLVRYEDGTLGALITARSNDDTQWNDNSIDPDHNLIYCRFNGASWSYKYIAKAGKKLFAAEADYTGLGALCPYDSNSIYISTTIDPRSDTSLTVHEIFKCERNTGVSRDAWIWTPVTMNSMRDNIRPIIPKWDKTNTAVLWYRGIYTNAQNYDAAIVGIIDRKSESISKMSYTDASHVNTALVAGSPLVTTGPDSQRGPTDDMWHERSGFGNGGSVFTASESDPEDAPALITRINPSSEGTYDVWINFWANPTADWRIKAGLFTNRMQLFRQMASKQVEEGDHDAPITLTGDGNTFLYQAYLGRIYVPSEGSFNVCIDDSCLKAGENYSIGDLCRTWYDGVSYAKVNEPSGVSGNEYIPAEFKLSQNYPNPFNPVTTINYSLPSKGYVSLKVYNIIGQEVEVLVDKEIAAGGHSVTWEASRFSSGVYFYKISTSSFNEIRKMVLLK